VTDIVVTQALGREPSQAHEGLEITGRDYHVVVKKSLKMQALLGLSKV
jgi:hypothetical protein